MTRDELFLVTLNKLSEKSGDLFSQIDRYVVGQTIGQNDRSVDNIVRMLAQANFIKKGNQNSIYLTQQGVDLARNLLIESNL